MGTDQANLVIKKQTGLKHKELRRKTIGLFKGKEVNLAQEAVLCLVPFRIFMDRLSRCGQGCKFGACGFHFYLQMILASLNSDLQPSVTSSQV